MVLVDSSVWIDYFNGRNHGRTRKLDELLSSTIVIVGDLILLEVLEGFKRDPDFRAAKRLLLELELIELGGIELALKAADNFRTLRKNGVTVRKTVDCVIATYCIEHRIPLLYDDRDFDPFVRHMGLRSPLNL
jgi:predicted nucleic acid-binding protein